MAACVDEEIQLLSAYETSIEETEPDECLYNTDKTDEISIDMDNSERSELPNCITLAELTGDKKYHLFISSASDDRDIVLQVVEELERKYGVKCLFHDRDFQPGTAVLQNIKEGISSSLKTVVFLTPNFMESRFCTLELEIAINNPTPSGFSSLIPVLYQDCNVPFHLEPRTYIDATLPEMTISKLALKIKTALDRSDRNGTSVSIVADIKRRCLCRPNQYKFHLTHTILRSLKDRKIDALPRQLQQVITLLNNDLMAKDDIKSRCSTICRWSCGVCPLGFFLCFVLYLILVFCITTRRPSVETANLMSNSQWVTYTPVLLSLVIVPALYWIRKRREKQQYVMTLLKSRACTSARRKDQDFELQADEAIYSLMKRICSDDIKRLNLPEADQNRHNVVNDRMCLCQLYEYGYPPA